MEDQTGLFDGHRDGKVKQSLIEYLESNPDMRCWQAIRAWCRADYVLVQKDARAMDTYQFQDWYGFQK